MKARAFLARAARAIARALRLNQPCPYSTPGCARGSCQRCQEDEAW
jgi:hypothetical protein